MTVRVGFVGVGYIAKEHLKRVLTDPEAEVVALCDTDPGAAETTRASVLDKLKGKAPDDTLKAFAQVPVHTDPVRMFRQAHLDAVFLCLPPFAHGEVEFAAIEAGIPFLVEKPVALDLPLARSISDALRAKGLIGAAGYQSRYSGIVPFVRETLGDRTIAMALAHRFTKLPPRDWYRHQNRSGGQVVEMATHQVDLLRLLVSDISTVSVSAGRRIATHAPTDIFDASVASLSYDNGAVGSLVTNMVSGHGNPTYARGIHIIADGLTVSILGHEGEARTVQVVTVEGRQERTFDDDSMAAQDQAFVRAVRDGRPELVLASYDEAVNTLAVTLAHQQSAETGQPVQVNALLSHAV
ncbi:Gfo/Idh/MocA family oxidoreductase [Streptomyces sp. SID8352]|uniref:Gfo/Idh/MocA family protein n=1 Tax=Streptomyces sp. SID8352 TaxID=2690338 RepID=UPI00136F0898|nr:Gfo/Idh/MocA family oxidoreductase [Streptomyces sp. SID8352]MYU23648.1 Gfo/Idh/MocA family oxidoreductase [Streptomyces sp. SID8352]